MINFKKTAAALSAAVMTAGCISVSAAEFDPLQVKKSDGFRYVVENDEVIIVGYDNTREPAEVIPSVIDGMPVTRIAELWGNVSEIIVPDSVKTIDEKAFRGNFWLTRVVIPESVTEIGEYVMENCEEEMNFFNTMIDKTLIDRLNHVLNSHFKRMTYTEAIDELLFKISKEVMW